MIEFLVDGAWCKRTDDGVNPPIVQGQTASWWRNGNWIALGHLSVEHPIHGVVEIVPRSFAARFTEETP